MNVSCLVAYVANRIARVRVHVLGLANKAADVALGVAVVLEGVLCCTIQAADVALGVAGIFKLVSSISHVITSIALGVAVVIEGVKTFPRSDEGDGLGCRVGIKVPKISVGKSPTVKSVALLFGGCRLIYERADVHSDMAEIRAVIRVKGYGHLIAFRGATNGNRTHDDYQGE